MYGAAALLRLARAYGAHNDLTLSGVGALAADNDKMFVRLARGEDCWLSSAEMASAWFDVNWPSGCPWPKGIVRSSGRRKRLKRLRRKVATPVQTEESAPIA